MKYRLKDQPAAYAIKNVLRKSLRAQKINPTEHLKLDGRVLTISDEFDDLFKRAVRGIKVKYNVV